MCKSILGLLPPGRHTRCRHTHRFCWVGEADYRGRQYQLTRKNRAVDVLNGIVWLSFAL